MKTQLGVAGAAIILLSACGKHEKPNTIYMPDMVDQPSFKAQEVGSLRQPVEGTVPRGFTPYPYTREQAELAGRNLTNPMSRTQANLKKGRELYNIYCMVCHGQYGEGDGTVVPKFPRPPSLQTERVRDYTDGRIYHIISQGQNLMPSYASQIPAEERWAVVHYLRVLYRAKHPTAQDLKKLENW